MTNLEQDKRIKKEINKFRKFIKDLDTEEKRMAMNMVNELAFMKITLEDLKKEVNANGVVTEMPQGEYSITRENPALKSYNTMIQRYNSTLKQLDDYINKISPQTDELDTLSQFLQKR
ncbi:hypothetical protein ANHYDRO_01405 [Anaerococcus hydrogenalis DSM 7454]|uniref:Uncharacterized protein n=1 Tax=Anaerococcus hydrogenalis DSM 7454 TaxID=561177 RepID=B6W9X9_9FIRM|nr:hypothetical protein [Anaerococcus hydrogenalis]EEB35739.1 hypothetical protein ANHYDRO_01405 [Anaerococcus hydrogenalis DSM 7454]